MKRALSLNATIVAAVAILTVGASPAARACQYCRQAYEDPDAGRMVTDNRGGSFSLDSSLSQYQAPPSAPPVELKAAPAPGSVATSANDLTVPGANNSGSNPATRRAVLPPPVAVVPVVPTQAPAPAKTLILAPGKDVKKSVARWSDLCLLGLVAAGGIFCWRTRRKSPTAS